jgi:hypothetical protein
MLIIVLGVHTENVANNYCPRQMNGFIEGVQELQRTTQKMVDIQFYDPAFNDEDKANIESMYHNNGLKLTLFPRIFSETDYTTIIENSTPTLLISFTGTFGEYISANNLVALECSCGHGKCDESFSWLDVLPLLLERNESGYNFNCPLVDFVNLSIFELLEYRKSLKNHSWKEIISFQLSIVISKKLYIEFNSNTPKFLEEWENREPNFLLTNGMALSQFFVYLKKKNFNYTENERNVLRNSWALYKRQMNLHS